MNEEWRAKTPAVLTAKDFKYNNKIGKGRNGGREGGRERTRVITGKNHKLTKGGSASRQKQCI